MICHHGAVSTHATIRGWLECDAQQLARIKRLITPHPAGYEAGWAFRSRHFNWTCFAFYGGDIRSYELEWFEHQLQAMAALPASDEDGDRVVGVFAISVAEYEDEAVQWLVRDGSVHEVPADPRHRFLDM